MAAPLRVLILDFDGVVVESNAAKDEAFEDFFLEFPEHADAMRQHHVETRSRPRHEKFRHFAHSLLGRPDDESLLAQMAERFSAIVQDRVIAVPEVPGVREFLDHWADRIPIYISSVTPHEELQLILRARDLTGYFKAAFGNPPHPKEDIIREILRREDLSPGEAAFVGDSPSDYVAAMGTGVPFVARDSGTPFDRAELELHPDWYAIRRTLEQRLLPIE